VVYAIGMPAATYDPPKKSLDAECTVASPHSENFFDLTKLWRTSDSGSDWIIKGQDYGTNFTMNICAPVLSNTKSAVGLSNEEQSTVGAFYEKDGDLNLIGFIYVKDGLIFAINKNIALY
jgi:cation-dependent mannose-6-phosphate receptor